MSDFKDALAADAHEVFLNLDEFADSHTVDGVETAAVIDDDILDGEVNISYHGQAMQKARGLYTGAIAMYVAAADMQGKPKAGTALEVDGKTYRVTSVADEDGIYKINMERTRGR